MEQIIILIWKVILDRGKSTYLKNKIVNVHEEAQFWEEMRE